MLRQITNQFGKPPNNAVKCGVCRQVIPFQGVAQYDKDGPRGLKMFCLACAQSGAAQRAIDTRRAEETNWTPQAAPVPQTPQESVPQDMPSAAPQSAPSADLAVMLADALRQHIGVPEARMREIAVDAAISAVADLVPQSAGTDETRVRELIAEFGVTRVQVHNTVTDTVSAPQIAHRQFPELLTIAQARDARGHRLNLWVCGAPGDGKTTATEQIATALGVPCCVLPTMSSSHMFFGYRTATGEYVTCSDARRIWEHGGVLVFDDFDGTLPEVAIELNAPLANGVCQFPDRMVPRHPDCLVILTANTTGKGATSEFNGRAKQDDAFLDRFVQIDWQIDEKLESATCGNAEWAARVQAIRKAVKAKGIKALVTPRASYQGAALLAQGLSQDRVERLTIKKSMTEEQWMAVSL